MHGLMSAPPLIIPLTELPNDYDFTGLPTYSDLPLFTPIFDPVTADSDFSNCTPIFDFSSIAFDIDRIFVLIASQLPLTCRYEPQTQTACLF